jgi:hypothetical protein
MNKTLKKVAASAALGVFALATILFSTSVLAASPAKIEAKYMVRNLTTGQIDYTTSVSAKPGDTVRYMVWYHNTENENSGINALDLRAVVGLPNDSATSHVSTAVVAGSNTNSVSNTVSVNTLDVTTLDYIEGSVYRVYNSGTNAAPTWSTVSVSDNLINGSGFVNPNMLPCWYFQESLTFDVKIVEVVKPVPPTPTPEPTPTPKPVVITGKGNVPLAQSGPAEAAAGAAGITAIGGAGYAWMRSKKALLSAITKIK